MDAKTGELKWKHQTGGQILQSAAYQDGVLFFGSQDAHAYALDARTGTQVWRSDKLPGLGWHRCRADAVGVDARRYVLSAVGQWLR